MSEQPDDDKVFRALASPHRRRIMDLLREEPMTTGALDARLPELGRCAVMQHLGVLEEAGIVVARRQGRLRWNHLDVMPIKRINDRWIGDYASGAVGLIARLKSELEGAGEATAVTSP
ncbi:ArsR family transcriptional regulator [Oceanicola sp. 22II-s10i]|uniref:ArsR/SmtB family transcription factor n=1 Tax=Oceanicola sp. 22II-s10i TaxID=1317116 RepID=UPI000B51FFAC|nr:metalloregulator ArsR/SmtB family transcription factor [Oceanicola sp. 22II-s10i]OWU86018.1 ArsR family transcriptional regulator [Oceanicola sp. 22II-s10i]